MVDIDIDKVCRVCLQSDIELSFIFDEQHAVNGIGLWDMISECTMYTVRRFDGFPDAICYDCIQRLRTAYEFRKQFEASHRKLISLLENKFDIPKQTNDCNDKCIQTDETSVHPCEKCDEKFITYQRLREHRLVAHKGTANQCRLCSKRFNRIADLKNHIAVYHPESGHFAPHECGVCKKKFIRKDHITRHMRKVHKLGVESKGASEKEDNDILDEMEIDVVQEPDSNTLAAVDPVEDQEFKFCQDGVGIEADFGLGQVPKEEIFSDCDRVDVEDSFAELNSFSSDEDEKPLSALFRQSPSAPQCVFESEEVSDISKVDDIKEEPTEVQTETKLEDTTPAENTQVGAHHGTEQPSKRRFKCTQCDKEFTRNNHVKRHLLLHSQEKPFSCHICSRPFNRADHLKAHLSKHSIEKPHKCNTCDRSFSRKDLLIRHRKQKHERAKMPRSEVCKYCDRSFSSKYYLQKHIRAHIEKNLKCRFCDILFESKESLKEHNKMHSTDKFLCSECGQAFIRKDYLLIHMRRHNGEKPYKCKYCEKGFPRATDLKVHERYHTGEKTHLCTICGKGFQRAYNLEVHMRVHTGERPYLCPHCPKKFSQGNDLKVHVRRHTGERFMCQICGTEFMQGYNLTQHNLTVHGIEDKSRKGRVSKIKSKNSSQEVRGHRYH